MAADAGLMPHCKQFVVAAVLMTIAGCGGNAPVADASKQPSTAASAPAPSPPRAASRPRVVVLGDSLTAGLGLPETEAYPALLQKRMDAAGYRIDVVNAGVSGDTSAGGLRRLDWALDGDVRVLVVALGANDGLRGLPVDRLKENLDTIITRAKERKITVVLAGMEAPPNYGPEYTAGFRAAYRDLARDHGVIFVPFLLDKVAGQSQLNQGDGIHPNAQGARVIAETMWQALQPVLQRIAAS